MRRAYTTQGVSEIMSNVAKIDNLPQTHTKEALLLLRTAWSNIDAYQSAGKAYKIIAKVSYFVMLFLGIAIIGIGILSSTNVCSSEACYLPVDSTVNRTVYALKEDKFENAGTFLHVQNVINVVTLGLSLATTIVASLTAYMNPAARWHHLKTSALALESEIWGFELAQESTGKIEFPPRDQPSTNSKRP